MDKLGELQNKAGRGIDADAGSLTLAAWLTRWLEMVRPTVEPNTYNPYERHVRLHITPILGGIRLAKLRRGDVVNFYPALGRNGVSPALQRKVGTTLTIALNKAVDLELIPSNPATKVKKPKVDKPEMQVLDPEQVARFRAAAASDRLEALFVSALDSGARPGELFALLWSDVDFERGFISITRSLEDIEGILRVKDVKTGKGRRRIDLSQTTLAVLAEHRKSMLADGHYAPDRPVFCDTAGGYLRISNLRKNSFKPILARAGLPDIRLYDLRHTCATLLLLADTPAKVVSERLGHSSVTLTLDTYSHVLPTMQRRAADIMGRILGRKPQAQAE
jgi:integrase